MEMTENSICLRRRNTQQINDIFLGNNTVFCLCKFHYKFRIPYSVNICLTYIFIVFLILSINFLPEDIKERARSLKARKVLIIHSQLIANTLRDEIGDDSAVTAASWFGVDERYSRSGDVHLADEDALAELISSGGFDTVISDGAVGRLLHSVGFGGELIELPHFAVSGQLWESGEAP